MKRVKEKCCPKTIRELVSHPPNQTTAHHCQFTDRKNKDLKKLTYRVTGSTIYTDLLAQHAKTLFFNLRGGSIEGVGLTRRRTMRLKQMTSPGHRSKTQKFLAAGVRGSNGRVSASQISASDLLEAPCENTAVLADKEGRNFSQCCLRVISASNPTPPPPRITSPSPPLPP